MIGVGIIGCGLIGTKRAEALGPNAQLIACADVNIEKAYLLAEKTALVFDNAMELISLPQIDVVIISTMHDSLAEISIMAIEAGKDVLVEKPAARNPEELETVMSAAAKHGRKVHVGFNLRYHRAMRKAKQLISEGALGPLMFLRGRYGHGGRIGYNQEWRANPSLSGGGELLDQGPHLTDLARWFMGTEFTKVQGFAHTYYWNMPVDDNGFMLLRNSQNQAAFLHASCSEWKNLFSMEIYGKEGKLELSGLGGSYGIEKLTYYKMLPEMGPPETTAWEYPMADNSWEVELQEFFEDIRLNREPKCNLKDAHETLKIIHKIYKDSGYVYSP